MNRRSWLIGGALAAVAVAVLSVGIAFLWSSAKPGHGEAAPDADVLDADVLAAGRVLYQTHCASCHGVDLDGQPNWQTPLPNGRLPAPPHDATGHTWHHADTVLLRIIREGTAAVVAAGYESDMPGFGGLLTDSEMHTILDFIKSTWPERERQYQREMTRRERGQQ